jgi:hypothetical protein
MRGSVALSNLRLRGAASLSHVTRTNRCSALVHSRPGVSLLPICKTSLTVTALGSWARHEPF